MSLLEPILYTFKRIRSTWETHFFKKQPFNLKKLVLQGNAPSLKKTVHPKKTSNVQRTKSIQKDIAKHCKYQLIEGGTNYLYPYYIKCIFVHIYVRIHAQIYNVMIYYVYTLRPMQTVEGVSLWSELIFQWCSFQQHPSTLPGGVWHRASRAVAVLKLERRGPVPIPKQAPK